MAEPITIEHRALRSAIEFAVAMGDELARRKQPITVPSELRSVSGKARIPTGELGRLRRAIEADERFRTAIAAGALPELVDPVGRLWLQRPPGWEHEIVERVAQAKADADEADLRTALRREEKRRHAAEQVAVRLRADVTERQDLIAALQAELDEVRADVVKADDALAEVRAELIDVRIEARHARDREVAAKAKLEAALAEGVGVVETAPAVVETVPVQAPPTRDAVDLEALADVSRIARELADRTSDLLLASGGSTRSTPDGTDRPRRRPLALPGGVIGSSSDAAEFLMRVDATVLVDGYNVAKLAWPTATLEAQRQRLLDRLENLARRFGTEVTVVFDGSSVVGAHAPRRRLVRVSWSPEGVTADDVIRDEVARLPASRSVVVVTNDNEIISDVKALGANVVPSNALIAVL